MRVGVLGLKGRMGQIVQRKLIEMNWECIELSFDKDTFLKQQEGLDGIIEFSSSEALDKLLDMFKVPSILASTGLSSHLKEKILEKSQHLPLFYSSNYSLGLNKLLLILQSAGLDASKAKIFETHHIHKKDAPSGTALTLQKELNIDHPITSYREGEVFGEHEIHYVLEGEILIFKHVAKNRDIFALGACNALKFLLLQKPGLYSMKDLLQVKGDPFKS
jgi:4-hydroxy-tetrahydrodipicolinate reductase